MPSPPPDVDPPAADDRDPPSQVTRLLGRLGSGDAHASEELLPLVYGELRGLAGAIFARGGPGHTLQPTAVVHEAWLKLAGEGEWDGRRHFFAVAGKAMHQVLIDHARAARADKRGGAWHRVTLDEDRDGGAEQALDLVALEDAVAKLAQVNERYEQVFQLRYLAGLDTAEIAEQLGVTQRTVQLDWRAVRAFLQKELGSAR